jgi:hypothetical protein
MGNTSGSAYAFMAVTPILPGQGDALEQRLAALPGGEASPLAGMGTTHFARWLVLNDLVYQGPPQKRDSLQSAYLFFVSNFDGELDTYLDAMLATMRAEAEAVWSCCVGFPGTADPAKFKTYLKHNQVETTFFVSAYPEASVSDVRKAMDLRGRITEFAITAQTLDTDSLHQAWTREFAGSDS